MLEFDRNSILQSGIDRYLRGETSNFTRFGRSQWETVQDKNRLNSEDRNRGGGAYTTDGCADGGDDAREGPAHSHTLCSRKKAAGCDISNSSLDTSSNRAYICSCEYVVFSVRGK